MLGDAKLGIIIDNILIHTQLHKKWPCWYSISRLGEAKLGAIINILIHRAPYKGALLVYTRSMLHTHTQLHAYFTVH